MDSDDVNEVGAQALDTLMRVAHCLRQEAKDRTLSVAESAVMTFDQRLRDDGWDWTSEGAVAPKGRIATLTKNPDSIADVRRPGWKLHRCADGEQCRAEVPGGCASGWCAHFEVKPDEEGVSRYPVGA